MNLVDLEGFVEGGLLFEVNRQFFHPLGLALAIRVDGETYSLLGIAETADLEGYQFASVDASRIAKSELILARQAERKAIRERALGYPGGIQPLEEVRP